LAEQAAYNAKNLAERCGVSLRQLERFFPSAMGLTPQRWLNALRQQKAFRLIASGQSVKEVSICLGYKQSSHFSRQFKQFHGVPPSKLLTRIFLPCRPEISEVALRQEMSPVDT
jgi:AraC-like DNA-binding protein